MTYKHNPKSNLSVSLDQFNHQPWPGSCIPCLVCHSIDPANSHQGVVIHSHEAKEVVLVAVGGHWGDFREGEPVKCHLHGRSGVEPSRDRESHGAVVSVSRVFVVCPHEPGLKPGVGFRLVSGLIFSDVVIRGDHFGHPTICLHCACSLESLSTRIVNIEENRLIFSKWSAQVVIYHYVPQFLLLNLLQAVQKYRIDHC